MRSQEGNRGHVRKVKHVDISRGFVRQVMKSKTDLAPILSHGPLRINQHDQCLRTMKTRKIGIGAFGCDNRLHEHGQVDG